VNSWEQLLLNVDVAGYGRTRVLFRGFLRKAC
jgi:hypothetical protein